VLVLVSSRFGRALVVFGVGCDVIWRLTTPPLRHFWLEVGHSELVIVVVRVCCKSKGECDVVAFLWHILSTEYKYVNISHVLKKGSRGWSYAEVIDLDDSLRWW
jgi:hypothetical protein